MIVLSQLAKMLGVEVRWDSSAARPRQVSLAHDPQSQDPLSQDPLSQDPLSQDPLSQDPTIVGVSSIGRAAPGTLVFADDPNSFATALAGAAAAVLVSPHAGIDGVEFK